MTKTTIEHVTIPAHEYAVTKEAADNSFRHWELAEQRKRDLDDADKITDEVRRQATTYRNCAVGLLVALGVAISLLVWAWEVTRCNR